MPDIAERLSIDYIESAGLLHDAHINKASILADRNIIGSSAQRNLRHDAHGVGIDHVERKFCFTAEIETSPIGRGCGTVIHWNTRDLVNNRLCSGVYQMNNITSGVGLYNSDFLRNYCLGWHQK